MTAEKKNGLFSNILFIMRYAWQIDKTIVLLTLGAYCFCNILYALFQTSFIIYFTDALKDDSITLSSIVGYIAAAVALYAIGLLVEEATTAFANSRVVKMTGKFQHIILKKSLKIDMKYYDDSGFYDDFVVATSQAEEMVATALVGCGYVCGAVCSILAMCAVVLQVSPVIAVIAFAGFIINSITRLMIMQLEYDFDVQNKRIMRKADYSKRVFYQPEYVKEIKMTSAKLPLLKQFDDAIDESAELAGNYGKKIFVLTLINWITVYTVFSYFCTPMYLGYRALVKRDMSLGEVAGMNGAHTSMRNNLDGLNYAIVAMMNVGKYATSFRKFINYEVGIEGKEEGLPIAVGPQDLVIDHMSFMYPKAEKYTLQDINMKIKAGEKVALVGVNGAGKTTFVKLLMRLYECTNGSIRLGDNNITEYAVDDYRKQLGVVFQNYQIYSASIAENVWLGEVHSEDHEKIWQALDKVGLGDKIRKLPKQLDTPLTKEFATDGVLFSGGESQRLAIARILVRKDRFKVAIMDEPSSALDPHAEYELNQLTMNELKDKTVLFVSHRLSTTKDVDCIYLFDGGHIREQGTHDELISMGGVYADMFSKQAAYYRQ